MERSRKRSNFDVVGDQEMRKIKQPRTDLTEAQIAWLAGLLEGEGCFHFCRGPYVKLSMTDKDIVERAAELMNGHCQKVKRCQPGCKPVFLVEVCSVRAIYVMNLVFPHMGKRRAEKIKEVLAATAARRGIAYGERCGDSKLTDAQAAEICNLYVKQARGKGLNGVDLGKRFGVSHNAIYYVLRHRKNARGERLQVP